MMEHLWRMLGHGREQQMQQTALGSQVEQRQQMAGVGTRSGSPAMHAAHVQMEQAG